MQEQRPSQTAMRVAERRAQHQVLDHPKVFEDSLALRFAEGAADPGFQMHEADPPPVSNFLRAFVVARSRYAEDELTQAVARGVRQYVILGAGLDTFAYRSPFPDLRVFEVDHPATQAWKRGYLDRSGIARPASLSFVAVDFERQSLAGRLRESGFDATAPAFLSWLGVTPYLSEEALTGTLRFIASLPRGSAVVFDYALPPQSLAPTQRQVFEAIARRVSALGEPFRCFLDPAALAAKLGQLGFSKVRDLDPAGINHRYFHGRADGLRVGGAAHLALAIV